MINFNYGDMWDVFDESDLFCVTTNGTVHRNDKLVMGAGIAATAKKKFPNIDGVAGSYCVNNLDPVEGYKRIYKYNFHPVFLKEGHNITKPIIGLLQTKIYWKWPSNRFLIAESIDKMIDFVYNSDYNIQTIHLPFPGIGLGKLKREDVVPILQQKLSKLSKEFTVWEYENER